MRPGRLVPERTEKEPGRRPSPPHSDACPQSFLDMRCRIAFSLGLANSIGCFGHGTKQKMTALRLEMAPAPGERLLRFVGDRVRFRLQGAEGKPLPDHWRGLLRANLGRGVVLRGEIITARG